MILFILRFVLRIFQNKSILFSSKKRTEPEQYIGSTPVKTEHAKVFSPLGQAALTSGPVRE